MVNLIKKKNIKRFISFFLFLIIGCQIFINLTYLFRNASSDRIRILGIKNEMANSLDMVYIGASCVFVFWNPMVAWQQQGITSYDYAISNMPATTYLSAIKEIQKTQTPKVIVIDLRTFLSPVWNALNLEGVDLGGYRSITDSWNLSVDRIKAITYYCKSNNVSIKDGLSSYIDLIYYHTNGGVLSNKKNWYLWNNSIGEKIVSSDFKGYMANHDLTDRIAVFDDFVPPVTAEEDLIPEDSEKCFRDLLQYCTSREITLLITASPYIVSEERAKQTNRFAHIASEYGVPFLDTNKPDIWQQIGLDPSVDFYNSDHVNVLGAEKYTSFLADYLVRNFDLPNHRNDILFASWQEMYENDYLPYIEPLKEYTHELAIQYQKAIDDERQMRDTDDVMEWFSFADNENITLLMCANESLTNQPSQEVLLVLKSFGMSDYLAGISNSFIGVYAGKVLYSNSGTFTYEGKTKTPQNPSSFRSVAYLISVEKKPEIIINGIDYLEDSGGDIHIIAIDNNSIQIVDSISIKIGESGNMEIMHLDF